MKMTPIASGGTPGQTFGNISTSAAPPDRIAAAKAIAAGEAPPIKMTPSDTPIDPQVKKTQDSIRSIKMKTNRTIDRFLPEQETQAVETAPQGSIPENNEQVKPELEGTPKPLSPHLAEFAKYKRTTERAFEVREKALADREKALESRPVTDGGPDILAQLKSQPLRVLQEHQVLTPEFYNALTEYLTTGQSGFNPEIIALKEEIKALKEGVDKSFTERDTQAEQQVFNEMQREAAMLAKEGDAFELVRETRSVPKVMELIRRTWKQHNEVLPVSEAMQLIESELVKDAVRWANVKKIQSQLTPAQMAAVQPQTKQMKTLTNRDSASVPLDKRTRAIMAALGTLKK